MLSRSYSFDDHAENNFFDGFRIRTKRDPCFKPVFFVHRFSRKWPRDVRFLCRHKVTAKDWIQISAEKLAINFVWLDSEVLLDSGRFMFTTTTVNHFSLDFSKGR
jgi:hypothetical protein